MGPFDQSFHFLNMSNLSDEHDWASDLNFCFSTDDDVFDQSLQHSMPFKDGTCPTSKGANGSGAGHDDTQYLSVRDDQAPAMSSLGFGKLVDVTASAAHAVLRQDQYPLATSSNIDAKHTRADDHSQKRPPRPK